METRRLFSKTKEQEIDNCWGNCEISCVDYIYRIFLAYPSIERNKHGRLLEPGFQGGKHTITHIRD